MAPLSSSSGLYSFMLRFAVSDHLLSYCMDREIPRGQDGCTGLRQMGEEQIKWRYSMKQTKKMKRKFNQEARKDCEE